MPEGWKRERLYWLNQSYNVVEAAPGSALPKQILRQMDLMKEMAEALETSNKIFDQIFEQKDISSFVEALADQCLKDPKI